MGRILTNRHVVAPQIDKEAVRKNINTLILQNYSNYLEQIQDSLNEKYSAIKKYASTVYQDVDGILTQH